MFNSKFVLASALTFAFSSSAFALTDSAEAAQKLAAAKVTIVQAIQNAEAHVGGRAISIDLDQNRKGLRFEVEVLANDRLYDVDVNALDGSILRVREDLD